MDSQKQIEVALHERTSNNLHSVLRVLNAIDEYGRKGYSLGSKKKDVLFNCLVDVIVNELPNRNSYDEEWVKKNIEDSDNEEEEKFLELAYYEAGKRLSTLKPKPEIEWLNELDDKTRYGFYIGYILDNSIIESIISYISDNIEDVVLKCDSCHVKGDELLELCKTEASNELSQDELISNIDPYNDGAYTMLPEYVDIIGHQLIREGNVNMWISLITSLKYFPLQGSLIYSIHNCDLCLSIMKALQGSDKVLHYLLRERLFSLLREEPDNLSKNEHDGSLANEIRKLAHTELQSWNGTLPDKCKVATEIWLSVFGQEELSKWLAHKEAAAKNKCQQYEKAESAVLGCMETFMPFSVTEEQIQNTDYSSLLYFAKTVQGNSQTKEWYNSFVERFIYTVFTEEGFFTPVLSDDTVKSMRNIYSCISLSEVDVIKATRQYIPADKADTDDYYQRLFRAQRGESYLMAILLLQTEDDTHKGYFTTVSKCIFDRFSDPDDVLWDAYFLPLYIGELIVTQVMPEAKDGYETHLIKLVKPIRLLLRVLTADETHSLSVDIKRGLLNRIASEWATEKSHTSYFEKEQIAFLDKYIESISKE